MSDEEDIMKKLQKAANRDCNFCWQKGENCDDDECEKNIATKILALINRQQAEIERLNGNLFTISNACMQRRNEATKEFAERLRLRAIKTRFDAMYGAVIEISNDTITEIVKELEGGENE